MWTVRGQVLMSKLCSMCMRSMSLSAFHISKMHSGVSNPWCIECRKTYDAQRYHWDRQRIIARNTAYARRRKLAMH